jgi:hypothetical protein
MSLPYPVIGNFTGSINSGSILSEQDNSLFYVSQSADAWFGFSPNDAIEISTYNVDDDTLVKWGIVNQEKQYKTVTSTYLDARNVPHDYTYRELIRGFIQYKNDKILIDPISDLNAIGVTDGSFKVSYNFIRNLAGNPKQPLSIKEISPSRTEIKLVPQGNSDVSYASFCLKKFPNRDVAPVLLSVTQKCPYDSIYRTMYPSYQADIEFLKTMFFLKDDGSVLTFLRNLYEDLIKYTLLTEDQITEGNEPTRISRTQGIRTYFSNYLLQNYDAISDFDSLEQKFGEFVILRINQQFIQYLTQKGVDYVGAKKFVYDFFFTYYYENVVHPLQRSHQQKYFGYLKNVLNFGNNKYFQILTHDFIDERQSPTDPLTLVVKLSTDLPVDITQKSLCWVSNFGMAPFIVTTILRNPAKYKTIQISAANFGSTTAFVSKDNVNKLYSSDDLALSDDVTNSSFINKSIATLNTDFSDFSNFVVFSSAVTRLNIFKNKIKTWTGLSASLSSLTDRYNTAISASTTYSYYSQESEAINTQITDLINSFDAYESYLFNSGNYAYSLATNAFTSASYVTAQDVSASLYDQSNRDYLVSNTPEYILNDTNNEEYLTFLSMVGHHFDNIYTYISALPIERQIQNELSSSIPTNTLKEMLYSFGWNVDDIIGNLDLNDVYLNSLNAGSYNVMSGEQRLQTIWNRILVTLPGIYKTKGTEECVRYLMACYGLPSSLISIREYGGTDYSEDSEPTYKLDEKIYMATFSGVNDYIEGPYPSSTQTVEFKFSVDNSVTYTDYQHINLFTVIPYPYTSVNNAAWSVGIHKMAGQHLGEVVFQMGSGSTGATIVSNTLPIFNGDIFSVMLRRYEVSEEFEATSSVSVNDYPTQYELIVQRNENGRQLFCSSASVYLQSLDNTVFSQFGTFRLSDGIFQGTLDKLSIWDIPINDLDFEEHVNDLNSYGYSGSTAYKNLWVRLSLDYPKSLYYNISGSSSVWVDNGSSYYAIPNYYNDSLNLSSSIDSTLWSSSVSIIDGRWLSQHPTGSVEIIARNFPVAIGQSWSASFNTATCAWNSASIYPYHYEELTYQQDIDASKYGPNKYKNKKIRKVDYTVEARFDSDDRSTSQLETISGESNQLGFFIDPQDSKNKDIIRYVGKTGIMDLIGDPANLYSSRYNDLRNKNVEYNSSGNKQTYFNEMLTIFKFYFDKSIFQVIKNVLPARANSFTGVVIEPTILERPKYQNRPMTSSAEITFLNPTIIDDIYTLTETVLWANFNDDWRGMTSQSQAIMTSSLPPSYTNTIDLTYINEPIKIRPSNLFCGYVTDYMDDIQHGMYGDYERLARGWEPDVNCENWIYGSVSRQKQNDLTNISEHHIPNGLDETGNASGSKHQILYYLMKTWDKFEYNAKSGEYVRSNNPGADSYDTASTYLYKYIVVDERFMNQYVHFYNEITTSVIPNNPSQVITIIGSDTYYKHHANTFKNTPNQIFSNTVASFIPGYPPLVFPTSFTIVNTPATQYFELIRGFPRNHFTHKATQFSKNKYARYINQLYNIIYVKSRQTIDTTINTGGISDGTFPVESFNVSNVNVKNSSNVIQYIPSNKAGSVIPVGLGGGAGTVSSTSTGGGSGISPTPTIPGVATAPAPSSGAGAGGCLLAGTQIMMSNGSTRNVEHIVVGDVLKSMNGTLVTVMELKPNRFHEHYVLNGKLKITYEHPVLIVENGNYRLVNTEHLKIGDMMLKYDGTTERLDTVVIVENETPTFNFVVDGLHLYVAEGIVVHNPIQKY